MLWIQVWKTSLNEGGLLVNSYYADQTVIDSREFKQLARCVAQFDLTFSGSRTSLICVTAQNAKSGTKWVRSASHVWAPYGEIWTGKRTVNQPLPFRWALRVNMWPILGRPAFHYYHDAIDKDELEWNETGECVLKLPYNWHDLELSRFGFEGSTWPNWLHFGSGSAEPGNPLSFQKVAHLQTAGVTAKNKARRAIARRLKMAVNWEQNAISTIAGISAINEKMWAYWGLDMPDFISIDLRSDTNSIIGGVVALAETFHNNQKNANGVQVNDGDGWNTRYGVTGAAIYDAYEFLQQKQKDDLKYLQKFKPVQDVSGEEYFHRADADEWFRVADDWYGYAGAFSFFDFYCLAQKDPKETERVDNYTPLYPDLPNKVEGLPRPQKNPRRLQEPSGLFV